MSEQTRTTGDPAPGPGAAPGSPPVGGLRDADVAHEPLWRIRLRLFARRSRGNWQLFSENRIGVIALGVIGLFGLMALLHPVLMGRVWDPRTHHPVSGYSAERREVTVVEQVTDPATEIDLTTARLRAGGIANVGDTVTVVLQPAPPSRDHLLGTDPLGRDVLSQLMYSARAAFVLGAVAAVTVAVVATIVGTVAAYFGGWADSILMRNADLILLMPLIPILIVLSSLFNIELIHLGLILGVLGGFGSTAIVLKSQALAVKVKPYIDAARVAGGGHWQVIFRHIVPNVLPLSFLYMMFEVTGAISIEAVLSFFGLLDVTMSWGIMLHTANTAGYLLRGVEYWWLVIPPGAAVTFLAASFFFVGRAMDEVVNPRLRSR